MASSRTPRSSTLGNGSERQLRAGIALQAAESTLRRGVQLAKKGDCFGAIDNLSQGAESLGVARGHLMARASEKTPGLTEGMTTAANLQLKLLNQLDVCLRPTGSAPLHGPSVWTRIFGRVLTWPRR